MSKHKYPSHPKDFVWQCNLRLNLSLDIAILMALSLCLLHRTCMRSCMNFCWLLYTKNILDQFSNVLLGIALLISLILLESSQTFSPPHLSTSTGILFCSFKWLFRYSYSLCILANTLAMTSWMLLRWISKVSSIFSWFAI